MLLNSPIRADRGSVVVVMRFEVALMRPARLATRAFRPLLTRLSTGMMRRRTWVWSGAEAGEYRRIGGAGY